jgi:hypothetical protein
MEKKIKLKEIKLTKRDNKKREDNAKKLKQWIEHNLKRE